jgi:hypothetical protein
MPAAIIINIYVDALFFNPPPHFEARFAPDAGLQSAQADFVPFQRRIHSLRAGLRLTCRTRSLRTDFRLTPGSIAADGF